MAYNVFIDGQSGTTGLLLAERLKNHPFVNLLQIEKELRRDKTERARLYKKADIVFFCLPDDAAREALTLAGENTRVIDASSAHRTDPRFVYGFPELSAEHRNAVKSAKYVSVPGCHASGFVALVYPLVKAGILPRDYPFTCFSLTGYTGGGKDMINIYESTPRENDLALKTTRLYAFSLSHKHLSEMTAHTGISHPPVFTPAVGDFPRGMTVSVPIVLRLIKNKTTICDIRNALSLHYSGAQFIKVMDKNQPENGFLDSAALTDTNSMELFVFGGENGILLSARLDNLGKGASGAALQCMNIMLSLPEEKGLL